MTPFEYFYRFFDNPVIDLIRNQTEVYAVKTRYRAYMYARGCQTLHWSYALFRSYEITTIQKDMDKRIKAIAIANAMTRKRFEKLKQCLHFNNLEQPS